MKLIFAERESESCCIAHQQSVVEFFVSNGCIATQFRNCMIEYTSWKSIKVRWWWYLSLHFVGLNLVRCGEFERTNRSPQPQKKQNWSTWWTTSLIRWTSSIHRRSMAWKTETPRSQQTCSKRRWRVYKSASIFSLR